MLYLSNDSVIGVPLPGPEEAFESVLVATRHEVDVEVGNALTHMIIDGHECSIGFQPLFDSPFQQLRVLEQRPDQGGGKVSERLVMFLWHEKAMTGEKRPTIQKGKRVVVFMNKRGLLLSADDAAKRAGCTLGRLVF